MPSSKSDKPGHFCGVAGVYSPSEINVPETLFFPLFSLQHRGQESAGVAYRKDGRTVAYKDLGMVSSVLARYLSEYRPGNAGIGHVRYSTHGGRKLENAQPLVVTSNKGEIALAHNGNLSNSALVKNRLFGEGSIFQTSSDSELFLHLISRSRADGFYAALVEALEQVEGAYSMVMLHDESLVAVRDPMGFRPLYIGRRDELTVVASETCALDILKVSDRREVEPGEVVVVDNNGMHSTFPLEVGRRRKCVFELIYFARPDSEVFGTGVHSSRKAMGAALARADNVDVDVVVPVPDSGNHAALGYAEESGLPFEFGLTRNHYAGRSFILPTTAERELAVRMKLHPVRDVVEGKRIVMVDDSLVRGTTARTLVDVLRQAGAAEIHLRLSSPEIRWPCFFGIDIPTREELISNSMSAQEIARAIGADSVMFLPIDRLKTCLDLADSYCFSCFTGMYPLQVPVPGAGIEEQQTAEANQ